MEYFVNQSDSTGNVHTGTLENKRIENIEESIEIHGKN